MQSVTEPTTPISSPEVMPQTPGTHVFNTGAVRSDDGDDVRYDLISPHALRRLAARYGLGAKKYGDGNYLKGIPFHNVLRHALQHLYRWMENGGRDDDDLAAAAWNIFTLMHYEETQRIELATGLIYQEETATRTVLTDKEIENFVRNFDKAADAHARSFADVEAVIGKACQDVTNGSPDVAQGQVDGKACCKRHTPVITVTENVSPASAPQWICEYQTPEGDTIGRAMNIPVSRDPWTWAEGWPQRAGYEGDYKLIRVSPIKPFPPLKKVTEHPLKAASPPQQKAVKTIDVVARDPQDLRDMIKSLVIPEDADPVEWAKNWCQQKGYDFKRLASAKIPCPVTSE
jgi:hypothetical protein